MSVSTLQILVLGEDRASGVLRNVGGALQGLGSSARQTGMDLLPLSAAAAAVAGSAVKLAADYQTSMNVLQATSGASAAEMAALDAKAIELGADMTLPATSAKDAAQAMLELSKAGLSVTDVLGASKGVLQMAAAGQLSNAEAARITANALNAFRLEGSEAVRVADLLAAAANASTADVHGMALSLQMAGAAAALTGQSVEDTTTGIALLANAGIAGSDAGTSLKMMLMSLISPSKKAANLMKELGLNVYDANGAMLPMPALVEMFSTKLGGLTQQQRNAALEVIFGSDAIRSSSILLMGGTAAWDAMSAAVNRGGAAMDLAAAQNRGFNGALDALKSTMETVLLTGARPLLDTLTGLVTSVSLAVGQFAAANPQLVTAGIAFAGVLAAAAPLALGIGALGAVIGALVSPIGLVVLAIAALAAAWATDFGGIREATTQAFTAIGAAIGPVITWFQTTIPAAVQALVAMWAPTWEQVQSTIVAIWNTVLVTVQTVINAVSAVIQSVLGVIQGFIATHGEEIKGFFSAAWTQIQSIITTVIEIVKTVISAGMTFIQTVIAPALQNIAGWISSHSTEIQRVLSTAWDLIKSVISTAINLVQGIVKTVLDVIKGDWSGAWDTVKATASRLWDDIRGVIENALNLLLSFFGTNLDEVKKTFETTWNTVQTTVTTVWNTLSTAATTTWNNIKSAILTPIETLETALSTTWERIKSSITGVWEDIKKAVTDTVNNLVNDVKGIFGGLQIHIPMPHFTVTMVDSGILGIQMPKVDVSWYGMGGDFVTAGPMLIGVGERGPERVQITPTNRAGAMGGGDAGGQPIVININNPVVREELDLQRLAAAVSEVFTGQSQGYRRMGYAG